MPQYIIRNDKDDLSSLVMINRGDLQHSPTTAGA